MQNRTSLYQTLQQRVFGGISSGVLLKRAKGSKYFVQCLQKEATLTGHEGCVNSIAWNDNGEYLLSGADDCLLNIYRPTERKLVQSIRSGHRANIFSAKFLPCSGDKWIVSCAGDGTIHFTDLGRESTFGQFQFDCHAGTSYEVITTPGDPNTFLSCGEDGTVRLFDLRTKTKCLCRSCKEDILIDCGIPVTSINLNPITPYHLAVGCEDSIVRVFDRRALSSSSSNKMKGLFCQFKPDSLTDRNYRVTSLHYSPDGSEMLVSYCADYVYLFTLQGTRQTSSDSQEDTTENGWSSGPNGHRNVPPLKRLRLRGDWSDTGPNARPESEHPSPESSLMQRMSDMFARWLDESFQAGQRHRARTSSSRSASSSSTASSSSVSLSPSRLSGSSSESSSTSGTLADEPRRSRSYERAGDPPRSGSRMFDAQEQRSSEVSMCVDSESGSTAQNSSVRSPPEGDVVARENLLSEEGNVSHSCTTSVELIPHSDDQKTSGLSLVSDTGCADCGQNAVGESHGSGTCVSLRKSQTTLPQITECHSGLSTNTTGHERYSQAGSFESTLATTLNKGNGSAAGNNDRSDAVQSPKFKPLNSVGAYSSNAGSEWANRRSGSLNSSSRVNCSGKVKLRPMEKSKSVPSHSECPRKAKHIGSGNTRDNTHANLASQSVAASPRTPAVGFSCSEEPPREANNVSSKITPHNMHTNRPGAYQTHSLNTGASRTVESCDANTPTASERTSAATRIQRVFRLHRNTKSFVHQDGANELGVPKMVRVYRGHRNSRTMIKEANFWGEDYVLSGSDCGRIFIWDKYTAELVMILQGDKHVVNCVQPHPFDPVLASSGIDYDIKLWAPIAVEPKEPENKEEIILRNEKMLEESRDTITVPASFMIRMLASLNHARFGQGNQDEDTESDSSDD